MSELQDGVARNHPTDRLTELANQMLGVLDRPENLDVKAIVFLDHEDRGGLVIHGYEDQAEAMASLFLHMRAVFQSMGKDLEFIGIPDSPEGLTDL